MVEARLADGERRAAVVGDLDTGLGEPVLDVAGDPAVLLGVDDRADVARLVARVADVLPDITKLGEPRRLRSAWLNGVKGFAVRYR